MSAFYDQASLVVVPSGYKTGKVYAQKPLTTDGQLTFSRASTATRVNSAGLIETVSSNVPRLDYLNSSCPKLILEPQRTNGLAYSEQFDMWTSAGGSAVANTVISPDGTQNADTLTGAIYQTPNVTGTLTFSLFAKKTSGNEFITLRFDIPTTKIATFNLNTGTVVTVDSGYSATITPYANGWYRCTLTSPPSTNVINAVIFPELSGSLSTYVWGAMLEDGAYATSYVKTTTAAVTRLADACSKTGISSLIGQTEGTLFIDMYFTNRNEVQVFIEVGNGTTQRVIIFCVNNVIFCFVNSNVLSYTQTTNERVKMAFAYKSGDFALYVNGVLKQASSATRTFGPLPNFYLGNDVTTTQANTNPISQALLFKTRLTNAQLAELTTL